MAAIAVRGHGPLLQGDAVSPSRFSSTRHEQDHDRRRCRGAHPR